MTHWIDRMVILHPWASFGVFLGILSLAAGGGGYLGARYPDGLRAALRQWREDRRSDNTPEPITDCDCRTEHEHMMRGHQ